MQLEEYQRLRLLELCDKHGWNAETLILMARALDNWLNTTIIKKAKPLKKKVNLEPVQIVEPPKQVRPFEYNDKEFYTSDEVRRKLKITKGALANRTKRNTLPYIHGLGLYKAKKINDIIFAQKYPENILARKYSLEEISILTQRLPQEIKYIYRQLYKETMPYEIGKTKAVRLIKAFKYPINAERLKRK